MILMLAPLHFNEMKWGWGCIELGLGLHYYNVFGGGSFFGSKSGVERGKIEKSTGCLGSSRWMGVYTRMFRESNL